MTTKQNTSEHLTKHLQHRENSLTIFFLLSDTSEKISLPTNKGEICCVLLKQNKTKTTIKTRL